MFIEFCVLGQLETLKKIHSYILEKGWTDGGDEITENGELDFSFDCNIFPSEIYDDISAQFSDVEIIFSAIDEYERVWISNDMDKKVFKAVGRVYWLWDEEDEEFEDQVCFSEAEMNKLLCEKVCEFAEVPYTEDEDKIESLQDELEERDVPPVYTVYLERVSREDAPKYL